ncbi:MAG: PASTA domain-containing protein [Ignavibacteriales bacterium]|nr:PASTA domain-containing protein [Ignavibacteriales bacterium]
MLHTKTFRIFVLACGVFVVAVVVLDEIIMPWYVNRRATLTVPDVVGKTQEEATKILEGMKLEVREGDTRVDAQYPLGTVIAQNPFPQQVVKQGRRVYLTISGGEQVVSVPALRGKSLRDAKFALERYGLKLGSVETELSREFPEGTIVSQSIVQGVKTRRGAFIGVTVSGGVNTDSLVVPDLRGKNLSAAQKILAEKGLSVGTITYQISTDLLPNTVLDQFPRPNIILNGAKPVDLFVAEAPGKNRTQREN